MYNAEMNEGLFDLLLEKAFQEKMKLDLAQLPDDEELEEMYPYTRRQMREERRLVRIAKYRGQNIALVYAKRVAVIVLAVISVSFGLLMTDEGIRAAVGEKLREVAEAVSPFKYEADIEDVAEYHDEYVQIDFEDVTVADPVKAAQEFDVANVEIGYIPEGYEYDYTIDTAHSRHVYYKDSRGVYIIISFSELASSDITIDSEYQILEKIGINGEDAFLSYSEEKQEGNVLWGNEIYQFIVTGYLPKEELLKIANNIKY